MPTIDRTAILRFAGISAAAVIATGCSSSPSGPTDTSGALPVLTVNFSGSGHWEEVHPELAGNPTRTDNANVTWQILYKVDFANRQITMISRQVTGTGGAAHSDQNANGDIVCSGPIVPDATQTNGPTLDLVDYTWPTTTTGSARFQTQAMGGSAFHLCDLAWATGIHAFPGYDSVRGDAPITINLSDWVTTPVPKTTILPTVDAHETAQEIAGIAPATLDVHWEGYFTVSKN